MGKSSGFRLMMCFLVPNRQLNDNIHRWQTDIASIEKASGITFSNEIKEIHFGIISLQTVLCHFPNGGRVDRTRQRTFAKAVHVSHNAYNISEVSLRDNKNCLIFAPCFTFSYCRQFFPDTAALRTHELAKHPRLKCPECPKVCLNQSYLKKQMQKHSAE